MSTEGVTTKEPEADAREALRRHERRQALAAELGRSALTGTPLEELVAEALVAIRDGLGADRVGLLRPREDGMLACSNSLGWPEEELRPVAPDAASHVAETYRTQEACLVGDFSRDRRHPGSAHLVALGLQSGIAVPVRGEEQAVGVLVAHAGKADAFGGDAVVFLRTVANVLAVVIAREHAEALRRESEADLFFLAEAGHVLASSLDYDSTLQTLASLVVPRLADWFIVDLAEPDRTFRRVAVAAAEAGKEAMLDQLSREYVASVDGPSPASRALARGDTVFFPGFTPESLRETTIDDRHFELMQALDPRSAIAVPLRAREGLLGALTFAWSESGRRYDEAGIRLAEEVARRASVAIENSRLYHELEQRAEAARALATVADGICLLDRDGVVRVWNQAAATITGLPAGDVLGQRLADRLDGWEGAAAMAPPAAPGEATGISRRAVPIGAGGRELWLSVAGVAAQEATVYTFRDVSDERRLDRLKSEFVATVSHELRTPLTAVYGAALTLAGVELSDRPELHKQLVRQIVDQAERLAAIIDDILLSAELEAGRLRLRPVALEPLAAAREAVEAARARLGPHTAIELTSDGALGPVEVDGSRLRQILDNLIENAAKYSPRGSGIGVHVAGDGERVRFGVKDEGPGIPAAEADRIFEKFYRLDPAQRDGVGGNGLGLYVCRELVLRMGGRIAVESEPGHGSLFTVELPCRAGLGGSAGR